MRSRLLFVVSCAAAVAGACSDQPRIAAPDAQSPRAPASDNNAPWRREKLVSIGTSISMGWLSNGVYAGSQALAWPALMRFGGSDAISLPLIQSPGCLSPLVAPLGGNTRLSGEPFSVQLICAPNLAGVQLPAQNVALAGTFSVWALTLTREAAVALGLPWYALVLPPGATQVSAALSEQPTTVSVELGGQDVLLATSGLIAFGVNVIPVPVFETAFDAVLDAVGAVQPKVLVFGMPLRGQNLPALRLGSEIWDDREEFAALHVDVSLDCEHSPNYINVSLKSLEMVFTAAFTSTHGLPNPVFSCADVPGQEDRVLTPSDIELLDGMLAQMAEHARGQAAARGYAFASLGALYDRGDLKPPVYSVVSQLTSEFPFGPYISLDGVHPGPLGHMVLAQAAAKALNKAYPGIAAHAVDTLDAVSLDARLVEPGPSPFALAMAKQIALQHQGENLPRCLMPGGCSIGSRLKMR